MALEKKATAASSSKVAKRPSTRPAVVATGKTTGKKKTLVFDSPIDLAFVNEEQKRRYAFLTQRKLQATRYVDDSALHTLGLTNEVNTLFNNIGWSAFMSLKSPTYVDITREFLSSYSCEHKPYSDEKWFITFRLKNVTVTKTLFELNAIFGLANEGHERNAYYFKACDAWKELCDGPVSASCRSSSLKPAHRYIHRVLSKSLFARSSASQVNENEIFFLWAMEHSEKVNTGIWIMKSFDHVVKDSGPIVIGGLITTIALAMHHDNFGKQVGNNSLVDLHMCTTINLCENFSANGVPSLEDAHSAGADADVEESVSASEELEGPTDPEPSPEEVTNVMIWQYLQKLEGKIDALQAEFRAFVQRHFPSKD